MDYTKLRLGCKLPDSLRTARAPKPPKLLSSRLAPAKIDRSAIMYFPHMGGNDVYPDCTAVGLVNAAEGVAALNGQ